MKRRIIAVALAIASASVPQAMAQIPVTDLGAIGQLFQQVQQGVQMLTSLQSQVRALTNVPQEMIQQAAGLLNIGIQNPLKDILGNLTTLQNGVGVGTCTGGQDLLGVNQYSSATALPIPGTDGSTGMDFSGAQINGNAARGAGLMACTRQMMQATQTRLQQMPELLTELQGCHDVSCTTAVGGRIQLETATIQAQQQQASLMALTAQQQRWTADDQVIQKMRQDSQALVDGTGGANALGGGGHGAIGGPAAAIEVPQFGQ